MSLLRRSWWKRLLFLLAFLLCASVVWAQFAVSPTQWSASLRCTAVKVFGTAAQEYVCSGVVSPPVCGTVQTQLPGLCYDTSASPPCIAVSDGRGKACIGR